MERLYMTQPYYATANRYFVREDSAFQAPSDLDGKRIGVCVSCSQEAYLKGELELPGTDVALDVKSPEIVVFEVEGPGFDALEKGTIDAFLAGDPVGQAIIDDGAAVRPLEAVAFNDTRPASWTRARGSRPPPSSRGLTRPSRGYSRTGR